MADKIDGKRALADIMAARMDGEFKSSAMAYIELMSAGYDELVKLATLVGEENDPFAAWESIEPIVDAHNEHNEGFRSPPAWDVV